MDSTFKKIEKKWQRRWEQARVFEANPDSRKKYFVNAPYPYMNSAPHIGHLYTYMRIEALARYKRLKGFNVLFPQGWHCTGSPIVAAAKRVEEGEEKQITLLKDQGFSHTEIQKLKKPENWTTMFPAIWIEAYKRMGFSYDMRRSFITTSLNPYYDAFVRWQFATLKEKGYIQKGKHPVVWDPKTNMPVGDHDRIKGEGETPQEFILVKHKLGDKRFLVSATLRHDTILGITNLYVHPDVAYSEIEIGDERWILGDAAVKKLEDQGREIMMLGKVKGADLIGKKTEEVDGRHILILPALFIDSAFGTGLVHSVPSDSSDDLIALKDLQKDEKTMKRYGLSIEEVRSIAPIPVLHTPGYGEVPAQMMLEKYKITSQNDRAQLESIKKELYKLSFYSATFNEKYTSFFSQDLQGKKVSEWRDFIKEELMRRGWVDVYYELTGEVISRSLTPCVVKIVEDQWFITYGDETWKKKTHKALHAVRLYPEATREQFSYTIDWLNDWACTREVGLGTRLPFDEKWLIESLSDSTLYLAYYTIAHLITAVPIEKINDAFFEYVFLGKGKKPNVKGIDAMRKEFMYWYPFDVRSSGKDLIQNHLTFLLFNHVAIFPKKYWPKGLAVNGWVRVDGEKMSKSLGNMTPLLDMADTFGADVSRVTILSGGEGLDDPNWDSMFAKTMGSRLTHVHTFCVENYHKGRKKRLEIDNWMECEINRIIKETEMAMEEMMFRTALQKAFFELQSVLKWYLKRAGEPHKDVITRFIDVQLLLLSPFAPFICEEIWENIGKKGFVSQGTWPKQVKTTFKGNEQIIETTLGDIQSILKLVTKKPQRLYVYAVPNEVSLFVAEKDFFKRVLELGVEVFAVNDADKYDPEQKSKKAKLGKPGIYVE